MRNNLAVIYVRKQACFRKIRRDAVGLADNGLHGGNITVVKYGVQTPVIAHNGVDEQIRIFTKNIRHNRLYALKRSGIVAKTDVKRVRLGVCANTAGEVYGIVVFYRGKIVKARVTRRNTR